MRKSKRRGVVSENEDKDREVLSGGEEQRVECREKEDVRGRSVKRTNRKRSSSPFRVTYSCNEGRWFSVFVSLRHCV